MGVIKDTLKCLGIALRRVKARHCEEFAPVSPMLILAPHPDDEIIGCGGLIARMVKEEHALHVVVLSGGGASHKECCRVGENELVAERRKLTIRAAEVVGLAKENIHFLDFTDGKISEKDAENMKRLQAIFTQLKPERILVPHHGEGWPDHLAARRIGLQLASGVTEVYEYCVWFWYYRQGTLDWRNAQILKMTGEEHSQKLAATDAYTKPLASCGKPWSGVLPRLLLLANRWNNELYFRVR